MSHLNKITLTFIALSALACNSGKKSKSGGGNGDPIPTNLSGSTFECSGSSTSGRSQIIRLEVPQATSSTTGRTLTDMSVSESSSQNLNQDIYNQNNGQNSYSNTSTYNQSRSYRGQVRYFQGDRRLVLSPDNTTSWTGELQVFTDRNSGSFVGQIDGVQSDMRNMTCRNLGRNFNNSDVNGNPNQNGIGQNQNMPSILTCNGASYQGQISLLSNSMGLSGPAGQAQFQLTPVSNVQGQQSMSYNVQTTGGTSFGTTNNGRLTLTRLSSGGVSGINDGTTNAQYSASISNVTIQNQVVNATLTCN